MKRVVFGLFSIVLLTTGKAQVAKTEFISYQQTLPGSTLRFTMAPIKSGEFTIGSNATEKKRDTDEGPQQKIKLSAFWIGAFEVTRDEFDVFYKDENTSENSDVDAITRPSPQYVDLSWGMGKAGGYPVNSCSQFAALMYCRWLYEKTGIFYRLPTEAEWEYACRAGSNTAYYFGDDSTQLDKYAWYIKNSEDKFQKVGQKLPNAWGLYDMLGNVMEWTLDHYEATRYEKLSNATDPFAEVSMLKYPKVLRGGSFTEWAGELRAANRIPSDPIWNRRDPQIPRSKWWLTDARGVGFRIVRPLQPPSKEDINLFYQTYLGR